MGGMSYNQNVSTQTEPSNSKLVALVFALSVVFVALGFIVARMLMGGAEPTTVKRKTKPTKARTQSTLQVENGTGGLQGSSTGSQSALSPSQNNFQAQ
jgi:uncharacterized membrane protein YgcG